MKTRLCNLMNAGRRGLFTAVSVVSFLSGCSTIQFIQYEQAIETTPVKRWHHSTLNGTVEISKPLNVQSICGKRAWTSITTEFTLLNALPVILMPGTPLLSFYSAWTNKVNCYELVKTDVEQSPVSKPK
ncbi:MAG: hypothetical protein KTR16_02555 [Acidiferrobacterales bacterium]|nr:hypothetical protein [Acidiferrobacterales bacterium]